MSSHCKFLSSEMSSLHLPDLTVLLASELTLTFNMFLKEWVPGLVSFNYRLPMAQLGPLPVNLPQYVSTSDIPSHLQSSQFLSRGAAPFQETFSLLAA